MRDRSARRLTDADAALWREVVKTVTPLCRPSRSGHSGHHGSDPLALVEEHSGHPINRSNGQSVDSFKSRPLHANLETAPPKAGAEPLIVDAPQGTDRRTAQRLRRGRLAIDAQLDLHGYSLAAAHGRLLEFLRSAQAHGRRCVLVVTGKGRRNSGEPGKLKSAVPAWLNEPLFRPMVLSVAHAQPKDGGSGALYILLRKARGHGSSYAEGRQI